MRFWEKKPIRTSPGAFLGGAFIFHRITHLDLFDLIRVISRFSELDLIQIGRHEQANMSRKQCFKRQPKMIGIRQGLWDHSFKSCYSLEPMSDFLKCSFLWFFSLFGFGIQQVLLKPIRTSLGYSWQWPFFPHLDFLDLIQVISRFKWSLIQLHVIEKRGI